MYVLFKCFSFVVFENYEMFPKPTTFLSFNPLNTVGIQRHIIFFFYTERNLYSASTSERLDTDTNELKLCEH